MDLRNRATVSAVLFGLDDEVASELSTALASCGHRVKTVNGQRANNSNSLRNADVIFCRADVAQVQELKDEFPQSPVVVASRIPEVSDWLDALEAGAADYCAAPFEPAQIRWVLQSHVRAFAAA